VIGIGYEHFDFHTVSRYSLLVGYAPEHSTTNTTQVIERVNGRHRAQQVTRSSSPGRPGIILFRRPDLKRRETSSETESEHPEPCFSRFLESRVLGGNERYDNLDLWTQKWPSDTDELTYQR